jgi:hypothetical protein
MTEISRSPERHTFQRDNYIKRVLEEGKSINDPEVQKMIEYYDGWKANDLACENDPDWRENNLEYDLRSCAWICDKVRASDGYAQNLYAAMCNMRWLKREILPILKDDFWSCSWRYAGGIIADMRQQGDYIDWYCSGIGNSDDGYGLDARDGSGYVPEGQVTEEISDDLYRLGWVPVEWNDED